MGLRTNAALNKLFLGALHAMLALCSCWCVNLAFAQGVYKWTDEKGKTHYSSEAPNKNARPAQLPKITKAPFEPKKDIAQETCSTHGGINCQAGADADGSVLCYDGFPGAVNRFNLSCTEARLEIIEIKKKEEVGEYAVFVRNQSGVAAKSPLLIYTFSRRQKREVPGPQVIAPFASEELSLRVQPGESEPTQVTLQVTCANCP